MQQLQNSSEFDTNSEPTNTNTIRHTQAVEPGRSDGWAMPVEGINAAQHEHIDNQAAANYASDTRVEKQFNGSPPAQRGSIALFFFREIVQVMLPALVLALIIHLFLAQATVVYGRSMEPNLFESQRLIIDKISYRFYAPRRNDIVVLDLPNMDEMLVKRIVGLPGETVEIHSGYLYVDGIPVAETFIDHAAQYELSATTLGPLNYFVLGDNRGNSNDSRSFGPVQRESIVGRVWLRYWPLRQFYIF